MVGGDLMDRLAPTDRPHGDRSGSNGLTIRPDRWEKDGRSTAADDTDRGRHSLAVELMEQARGEINPEHHHLIRVLIANQQQGATGCKRKVPRRQAKARLIADLMQQTTGLINAENNNVVVAAIRGVEKCSTGMNLNLRRCRVATEIIWHRGNDLPLSQRTQHVIPFETHYLTTILVDQIDKRGSWMKASMPRSRSLGYHELTMANQLALLAVEPVNEKLIQAKIAGQQVATRW
ncbi:MAG: hypothetical protein WAM11_09480 [Cyanobium sp.]